MLGASSNGWKQVGQVAQGHSSNAKRSAPSAQLKQTSHVAAAGDLASCNVLHERVHPSTRYACQRCPGTD
jgi:hypothetical protein